MTILSSGNIGINNSSPSYKLHLIGGSEVGSRFIVDGTYAPIQFSGDNGTTIGGINAYATRVVVGRGTSTGVQGDLIISSSGNISMATTVENARLTLYYSDANNNGIYVNETTSAAGSILMYFTSANVGKGTIRTNSTNTGVNYNTTSDYRLKEDLKDFNGLDIVSKIKTYNFKWKNTNHRDYGVMAHELQGILPSIVSGEKDSIDKFGSMITQDVDYGKLTSVLVKAVQELKSELDQLKAK